MAREPILVTGGAGFIGSNFVHQSIAAGDRILNLDALTYAGNPQNVSSLTEASGHIFIKGSINDERLVKSLFEKYRPRAVVNFAAESHVDRSIDSPAPFIETNIVGTQILLDCARSYLKAAPVVERKSFRFLHVSTDEVYGSIPEGAAVEDSTYRPNSPYAASKAAADHLVRAYGKTYDLPVLISNCTNNYGPYQFPEKLIPLTLLKALEEKPIPIYGDGGQVRDWLHVEDHCKALRIILEKGALHEKYNVSAENRLTNLEVVRTLCRLLAVERPRNGGKSYEDLIEHVVDRPGHDRRYALDASKLRKQLGWKDPISFDVGLAQTIRWYLSNEAWWKAIQGRTYQGDRLGVKHA